MKNMHVRRPDLEKFDAFLIIVWRCLLQALLHETEQPVQTLMHRRKEKSI